MLFNEIATLNAQLAQEQAALAASVANAALAPYPWTRWDRVGDVPGYITNVLKPVDIATDLASLPKKQEVGWLISITQNAAQTEFNFNFPDNFWPCTCIVELSIGYAMTFANGITAEASQIEFLVLGSPFTTANVTQFLMGLPVETTSGQEDSPNDADCATLARYQFTITPSPVPTIIAFAVSTFVEPASAAPSTVSIGNLSAVMISSANFVP